MIGVYDYTVLLTYLSLFSASSGIVVSLWGSGHPYLGTIFLLICGLLDAFDGRVARTKKDRTDMERRFGIQIDSLSDLVAFGVLPACIGAALILSNDQNVLGIDKNYALPFRFLTFAMFAVLILYILAAMIRLAYYNVTEEERQQTEGGVRKYYTGLPVTMSSLFLPVILFIQYLLPIKLPFLYFAAILFCAVMFVSKIQVQKPGKKGIRILVIVGSVEFVTVLTLGYLKMKGII